MVSDARERALKAGLELITTCFLKRATHKEVACLVWERESADSRRLHVPRLVVSLEEGEQVKLWGQLRPAHLVHVEGEPGMEHNLVRRESRSGKQGHCGRRSGWLSVTYVSAGRWQSRRDVRVAGLS